MRYLLITFIRKPNGQIDEQVAASKKVKPTDEQTCNIILDFGSKKILKSIVERKKVDMDFDKLVDYYKKIYPQLIEQLEKDSKFVK